MSPGEKKHLSNSTPGGRGRGRPAVVVGLGKTGLACARHLPARGRSDVVTDSRERPPQLEALQRLVPEAVIRVGGFDMGVLEEAAQLVVSPGVALDEPFVREALARKIPVWGDIDLFAAECRGTVIGVTGSNGKSTVTTLLEQMLAAAGTTVRAGGNLGRPALDLLDDPAPEFYVLELSSFQLERTHSLHSGAATVLNVSPDHMDRHGGMATYARAKQRIYEGCEVAVVNRDDALASSLAGSGSPQISFGTDAPPADGFGLIPAGSPAQPWLAHGTRLLLPLAELGSPGLPGAANALAALALAQAVGVDPDLETLRRFRGLPHRTQLVSRVDGIDWIDDSKATNVGATVAAVTGLPGPIVLIAGGDAKGGDFAPLAQALRGKARAAVLIGRDAPRLAGSLEAVCEIRRADSMDAAVATAHRLARDGDTVLLSPACASQDMFVDYAARGEAFAAAVARSHG